MSIVDRVYTFSIASVLVLCILEQAHLWWVQLYIPNTTPLPRARWPDTCALEPDNINRRIPCLRNYFFY